MRMSSYSRSLILSKTLFWGSGALSLTTSGLLFRDLTDFSQWVKKPSRNNVWVTYRQRHELAAGTLAGVALNTAVYFLTKKATRPAPFVVWAGCNVTSLGLFFLGYFNNELMFRERNRNALFVATCQAAEILKPMDMAIVTQIDEKQEPVCFPDHQITRPHIARVGTTEDGTPVSIAYCGLTGTGIIYETPPLPDGRPREFMPLTQLENNLVVMDRTTGHIGHQINGLDETKLLEAMGEDDYDKVGRRPATDELLRLGIKPAKEVASWRMTVQNFAAAFPHGKVFINDYKEFPDLTKPVLTIYDKVIDLIFYIFVDLIHNHIDAPLFPTIEKVDDRLPPKTRVWGFNVGDDYVALTQDFVQKSRTPRNLTVGGQPLVACWDPATESLGVWLRPNKKPIYKTVNVYGEVEGRTDIKLKRLSTVKNGLFWFSWANFYPQTVVNPET